MKRGRFWGREGGANGTGSVPRIAEGSRGNGGRKGDHSPFGDIPGGSKPARYFPAKTFQVRIHRGPDSLAALPDCGRQVGHPGSDERASNMSTTVLIGQAP